MTALDNFCVAKIEVFILRTPLGKARFWSSQASFPERNSLLVKITASDGLIGWGEAGQPVKIFAEHFFRSSALHCTATDPDPHSR